MNRIFLLCTVIALVAGALSCGNKAEGGANGDTPTEAYKRLFAAVKSGNSDAIRAEMTKKTVEFAALAAKRMGKTADEQIKFGMTRTTYADILPTIRDERVKDKMGAVEVWNSKDGQWDDLPFMVEDGKWKIAYGEAFGGIWHSPGKGRDQIEKEAGNAVAGPPVTGANLNANVRNNTAR